MAATSEKALDASNMEATATTSPEITDYSAKRGIEEDTHERTGDDSSSDQNAEKATPEQEGNGDAPPDLEKKPSRAASTISQPPNGGLVAWTQVAGAWVLLFDSWGIVNAFGEYQTYYESGELFHATSLQISWIGSVQAFMLLFVGAITGPVFDKGHFRILILVGTFLCVFGHMMLSLCDKYWEVLLAQGFCAGIGLGMLFVPAVTIMSSYFTTRLQIAMGLTVSGSAIGGIIYPIMFHKLLPEIGFAWTTRVIGFLALGTLLLPLTTMKMRSRPPSTRSLYDFAAFKELPYLFFCAGITLAFFGLLVPFFYISFYAIESGMLNANLGFYLLAILNASSVFGRTVPNFVAARIGPMNMLIPCCLITSILIFCLIPVNSEGGIITIALLYGLFSGCLVSLPPTILVSLTANRGKIGTRIGQCFTCASVGLLVGPPVAGAIAGSDNNFTAVWIFAGCLALTGSALIIVARMFKANWKIMVSV